MNNVNVKVTRDGEILRLKTMFEVIDMAEEAWSKHCFKIRFKYCF